MKAAWFGLTATIASALCWPSAGLAQREIETGHLTSSAKPADIQEQTDIHSSNMSAADRARATVIAYAQCLVERDRRNVERGVALFPGSTLEISALSKLAVDDCLRDGTLQFTGPLLRGALFIALYRRDYGRAVPELKPDPVDFTLGAPAIPERGSDQQIGLRTFADCVVRADPVNARVVVIASVAGSRETQGYIALRPRFNACMPQGVSLTFSKSVLSGLIAEALYRQTAPVAAVTTRN